MASKIASALSNRSFVSGLENKYTGEEEEVVVMDVAMVVVVVRGLCVVWCGWDTNKRV